MENIVVKYRGWLFAFLAAVTFSVLIAPPQVREISTNRLRKLVEHREVASITIVESKTGNQEKYIAEITLTTVSLEKYRQPRAGIWTYEQGPHFVASVGKSREEVKKWKAGLGNWKEFDFSFEKR